MNSNIIKKRRLTEGSETYLFFTKTKRFFATVHGPGTNGPNALRWYGPLRVQKSTVFNDVKLSGQSFRFGNIFGAKNSIFCVLLLGNQESQFFNCIVKVHFLRSDFCAINPLTFLIPEKS